MIYSANYLVPENVAINATINNVFSWQTNVTGGDTQVAYQVFIYRNDTNALVYDSSKVTSSSNSHTIVSDTLSNTSLYDYKWFVRTWKDLTIYSDSDWVLFKCNSNQIVSFTVPAIVDKQVYNFTATYSQSESVKMKFYRFLLYDNASTPNIIEDTGLLYSATPTISYNLSGLIDGESYNIKLQTISQNDISIETGLNLFSVAYNYPPTSGYIEVTADNTIAAIKLSWENIKIVNGYVNGSYSYVPGKFNLGININANSNLYYNEIYGEDFTISFWVKLDPGFIGKIVELTSNNDITKTMEIGFDGNRFYYKQNYRNTAGQITTLPSDYFLIGIKSSEFIVVTPTYTEVII